MRIHEFSRLETAFTLLNWTCAVVSDEIPRMDDRAMQQLVSQCITRLNRIVRPNGHNVGLSTSSELLLGKSNEPEDISSAQDCGIMGYIVNGSFHMEIKVLLEPTPDLHVPKNATIRLFMNARPRGKKTEPPMFAATKMIMETRPELMELMLSLDD